MAHSRLWIAAISVVVLASPSARAQGAEAESLFNDGAKLMAEGKIAEGCDAFEASNRIDPRAGTMIRLAECRETNHQLAAAWSAYKDALTRVKDPKKRAIATAKIAELEPRLSYLTIRLPAGGRLDGLAVTRNARPIDPGEWDRAVPIDGGSYAIAAHAPGHRDWQTTVTVPEASGKVVVDVPQLEVTEPTHGVAVVTPPAHQAGEAPRWSGKRKAAVAAAAVAVLGAATGALLGVIANHERQDADKLCPQMICATSADVMAATNHLATAHDRALVANISFGVAGAAAIAATVLWFTSAPERASGGVAIAPAVAPGTFTLTVTGGF